MEILDCVCVYAHTCYLYLPLIIYQPELVKFKVQFKDIIQTSKVQSKVQKPEIKSRVRL